jgi:predicted nucleic acid-binding protein
LVDASILVRYLVKNQEKQSPAAKRLIDAGRRGTVNLEIPLIAVAETIFTLESVYEAERSEIAAELLKILTAPWLRLTAPAWVLDAVEEYRIANVSFGDACMAAEARTRKVDVAAFDRGFDKLPGIKRFEPT